MFGSCFVMARYKMYIGELHVRTTYNIISIDTLNVVGRSTSNHSKFSDLTVLFPDFQVNEP